MTTDQPGVWRVNASPPKPQPPNNFPTDQAKRIASLEAELSALTRSNGELKERVDELYRAHAADSNLVEYILVKLRLVHIKLFPKTLDFEDKLDSIFKPRPRLGPPEKG